MSFTTQWCYDPIWCHSGYSDTLHTVSTNQNIRTDIKQTFFEELKIPVLQITSEEVDSIFSKRSSKILRPLPPGNQFFIILQKPFSRNTIYTFKLIFIFAGILSSNIFLLWSLYRVSLMDENHTNGDSNWAKMKLLKIILYSIEMMTT